MRRTVRFVAFAALFGLAFAAAWIRLPLYALGPGPADEVGPLIDVQGGRVVVEFGGGCQGCGMADVTLREGVTATLRRAIPEITEVVDATDHEAGESPYHPR